MDLNSITSAVTTFVALLTIPGLLYGIFRLLRKISKKQIQDQLDSEEFKRDTYRNRIIRFQLELSRNPDEKFPEHIFQATLSDYDKYKALGGNTYVDSVIRDIRDRFENNHGRRH